MGIDLRGRYIAVAEQHLYDPEVRAMIHQMGRKCVSQHMRGERFLDPGDERVVFDPVPEGLARHGPRAPA